MAEKDNPYSLERLADRAAIHDLLHRGCRAVDRGDYDAIAEIFHADGIDNHGGPGGRRKPRDLSTWVRARHASIPFSMHMISNILIEFTGPDEAAVETYCLSIQRYPVASKASLIALMGEMPISETKPSDLVITARYADHITRRNGEWKIQERVIVYDSSMLVEAASEAPFALPELALGTRDLKDPVYQLRERLGLKS